MKNEYSALYEAYILTKMLSDATFPHLRIQNCILVIEAIFSRGANCTYRLSLYALKWTTAAPIQNYGSSLKIQFALENEIRYIISMPINPKKMVSVKNLLSCLVPTASSS